MTENEKNRRFNELEDLITINSRSLARLVGMDERAALVAFAIQCPGYGRAEQAQRERCKQRHIDRMDELRGLQVALMSQD